MFFLRTDFVNLRILFIMGAQTKKSRGFPRPKKGAHMADELPEKRDCGVPLLLIAA